MIQAPDVAWDGNIESFKNHMNTLVNPELIIDLAESIVSSALDCLEAGTLKVDLESGKAELYYRYLKLTER